jgi:hypothetical protein
VSSIFADGTEVKRSEVVEDAGTWVRIDIAGDTATASGLKSKADGFEFALSSANADLFEIVARKIEACNTVLELAVLRPLALQPTACGLRSRSGKGFTQLVFWHVITGRNQ